ncbi:hypothetical protein PVAP13_8KG368302 [Panicum virgatum]|uniref:Uncharacterized protein n=1 Tax=Panicum virgatum TaxID=38727 RepID=A0A8T0PSG9_PANVG|nr:hypothetical protein PVAP13_8KG368302 [Panicum virgatum]
MARAGPYPKATLPVHAACQPNPLFFTNRPDPTRAAQPAQTPPPASSSRPDSPARLPRTTASPARCAPHLLTRSLPLMIWTPTAAFPSHHYSSLTRGRRRADPPRLLYPVAACLSRCPACARVTTCSACPRPTTRERNYSRPRLQMRGGDAPDARHVAPTANCHPRDNPRRLCRCEAQAEAPSLL